MCDYCSEDKDVDVLDRTVISTSVDLGFAGEISVIDRIDPSNAVLELSVLNDSGEAKVYKREIMYCPFCGRKLV